MLFVCFWTDTHLWCFNCLFALLRMVLFNDFGTMQVHIEGLQVRYSQRSSSSPRITHHSLGNDIRTPYKPHRYKRATTPKLNPISARQSINLPNAPPPPKGREQEQNGKPQPSYSGAPQKATWTGISVLCSVCQNHTGCEATLRTAYQKRNCFFFLLFLRE
ncbi:hypothetical protein J3E69DRAFT_133329 [Trichoderma sp. SZMC 28015]